MLSLCLRETRFNKFAVLWCDFIRRWVLAWILNIILLVDPNLPPPRASYSEYYKLTSIVSSYWMPYRLLTSSTFRRTGIICTGCFKVERWTRVETWTKSLRCVLILYIHFMIYIYFSQHNYIIKAQVKATCFDLKCHRQAKLRTMKFFTMWLCPFGIPSGSQCVLRFVRCT